MVTIVNILFFSLFCDVCYRTLEHPYVAENRVSDTIFQMLGNAIKRYNHALTFPVKILQLLSSSEVSVVPTTHGLYLLYKDFGIKTIFATIIREFIEAVSIAVTDAQTVKNFNLFMTEVATLDAKLLIPLISSMSEELLNLDVCTIQSTIVFSYIYSALFFAIVAHPSQLHSSNNGRCRVHRIVHRRFVRRNERVSRGIPRGLAHASD